ncbi:F0F1 ATP synthase subunit B [Candidatus Saccharibacteria bacterium]|nr:F0F1 ATP synthase subunit B [Candidatus Saccharibacteria bacterium]
MISLIATAETSAESGGVFGALGIDWKLLILQAIAFGFLVFILAKWVYPPILKMLDRREKLIEDSVKAAKEAGEKAESAAAEIASKLKKARSDADDIVNAAREQSTQILADSEKEAARRAEQTVEAARQQLARDVEAARKVLRDETISLVAMATEKVVGEKVDTSKDAKLIRDAIKESEK